MGHSIGRIVGLAGALCTGMMFAVAVAPGEVMADDPEGRRPRPEGDKPVISFNAHAETRQDGVHVQVTVREFSPGSVRTAQPNTNALPETVAGEPIASNVVRSAAPVGRTWVDMWGIHHETPDGHLITLIPPPKIIGWASLPTWERWQGDHPNENPYIVNVDDRFGGVIWVPGGGPANFVFDPLSPEPGAPGLAPGLEVVDPMEVVREILGFLPLPNIKIRMNPSPGLVALAGWFWVDGYDGQPFGGAKTVGEGLGAVTIEVRVWPSKYEWSFGDGATLVSKTLGKPYPAESEIKHTYEYSSFGQRDGFPVELTVTFEAEYRVNNGPWQRLAPIRQTYRNSYPVQEAQTVLVGR